MVASDLVLSIPFVRVANYVSVLVCSWEMLVFVKVSFNIIAYVVDGKCSQQQKYRYKVLKICRALVVYIKVVCT